MRKIRKDEILEPLKNAEGEVFYELIGRGEKLGNTDKHSFGIVVVKKGYSTNQHYHQTAEETYYFLRGSGTFVINDQKVEVKAGDAVLIEPNERHQLFANEEEVEAIVVCAPAWSIDHITFC